MFAGAILVAASIGCATAAAEPPQAISFVRDGRIVMTDAVGRSPTPLVPKGGRRSTGDREPTWDPSGRTLYFSRVQKIRRDDSASQIHFLAPDGVVRRLTPRTSDHESSPAVSPNGAELAFARTRVTRRDFVASIVIRSLTTGAERVVVRSRFPLRGLGDPQWAPDAKSLLYTRTRIDRRSHFRPSLRVVGLDGSGDRLVRRDARAGRYSPDGRRVAFASVADRNGKSCGSDECDYNGELYVMNADGTGVRRLTTNSGADEAPSWSADGKRLAFSSTRNYPDAEQPEIYTIGADGSCLTWLTNGTQESRGPAWRPGSGASDPAGCGAVGRRPLYATSERALKRVRGFRALWLGRSIGTMMLSDVYLDAHGILLSYADCSAFDEKDCGESIDVSAQSVCKPRELQLLGSSGRLRGFRGVPLEDFGGEGYWLYAGRASVRVGLVGSSEDPAALRRLRPALRALRPYPASQPAGRLPAVRLPTAVLRRVRRVSRLRRLLGSVDAVARVTGSHVSVVRRRLEVARALRRLPGGRPVRCR